jgi:predicted  nucleic acid-binding Zn-ribbon protein
MAKAVEVDSEDLMERMKAARERADDLKAEKSRLTGELETHEKRLKELEDECKKKFSVSVSALPGKAAALKKEAEELISKAEGLLGDGAADEGEAEEPGDE